MATPLANTGGTAASALPAAGGTSESTLSSWAGPYVTNMLGKAQAVANEPYQVYQGPMTAGQSNLQSKVFQGLGGLNFPGNLGQSFSSGMGGQQPQYGGTSAAGGLPPGAMAMPAYKGSLSPNMSELASSMPMGNFTPDPSLPEGMVGTMGGTGFDPATGRMDLGTAGGSGYYSPSGMGGNAPQDMRNMALQLGFPSVMPQQQTPQQYDALQAAMQKNNDALVAANRPPTFSDYGSDYLPLPPGYNTGTAPTGIAGLTAPQASQQPSNIAQSYMNPYLQSVLNPQMDELRRQNEITNMQANAKLTGAGAFGGGRQAIMNAENARNLMQEQNKTVGQGYASAYDKAMGQFNTEQGQSKDLVNMLANAGQAERGIEQEGITADYNEFLAQRDDPMKKTQYLQSMLQGLPYQTVTNSPLGKSGMGQLAEITGSLPSVEKTLRDLGLLPPA